MEITILAERHTVSWAAALRLRWPASHRSAGAALHAKILVVDRRLALVGSANFTGRGMESNLECGILIRGGPQPGAILDHIAELRTRGELERAAAAS